MTYTPPDPSTYAIPSRARRLTVAALYLIPGILLYVVLPYAGISYLARYGIGTGYTLGFIVVAGVALAVLGAARYYLRPTRAYGPISILGSVAAILYLLALAHSSTVTVAFSDQGSFALDYAGMLLLFAFVPAIRIGSGSLTTLEDWLRPGERLPFDFPVA